jgi:hypothetical protein
MASQAGVALSLLKLLAKKAPKSTRRDLMPARTAAARNREGIGAAEPGSLQRRPRAASKDGTTRTNPSAVRISSSGRPVSPRLARGMNTKRNKQEISILWKSRFLGKPSARGAPGVHPPRCVCGIIARDPEQISREAR